MTTLQEIGTRLGAGESLTQRDAEAVVASGDLLGLGALADDCRRQRHGDRVTFVRVQELHADVLESADLEILAAAGEVRIAGRITDRRQAVRAVEHVVYAAGSIPVTGFALDDIAESNGWETRAVEDLLAALKAAGLSSVAEARADRLPGPEWLEAAGRAGMRVARLTVGAPDGDAGGVDLIRRVAAWDGALAHVHAFAPLARARPQQPTTGYRDLRQVALARLLVENVDSIQVDWRLYGPKLAQVALIFGASDVDAVSPDEGGQRGARRAPLAEINRNIRASALVPVERNGRFEPV